MPHIDYYFTTVSPYAYLAGNRLEEIAARHGATITYKPVDLGQLLPRTGGVPLGQRAEARKVYRLQELRRQSKKAGLPMNLQPQFFPTNPAPAAYAIIAAQKTGGGNLPGLVHAILRACWAEEKNIAEDAVIREALAANGFDPALTDKGMLSGAEEYAANLEEAFGRHVFGAPFYMVGEEAFWGQDRLDDLDLYLSGKL